MIFRKFFYSYFKYDSLTPTVKHVSQNDSRINVRVIFYRCVLFSYLPQLHEMSQHQFSTNLHILSLTTERRLIETLGPVLTGERNYTSVSLDFHFSFSHKRQKNMNKQESFVKMNLKESKFLPLYTLFGLVHRKTLNDSLHCNGYRTGVRRN